MASLPLSLPPPPLDDNQFAAASVEVSTDTPSVGLGQPRVCLPPRLNTSPSSGNVAMNAGASKTTVSPFHLNKTVTESQQKSVNLHDTVSEDSTPTIKVVPNLAEFSNPHANHGKIIGQLAPGERSLSAIDAATIREKLVSELGCTLSIPEPAKPTGDAAHSSRTSEGFKGRDPAHSQIHGHGCSQGRGRGRDARTYNTTHQPVRTFFWPAKNEISKPDPKRWDIKGDSEDCEGSAVYSFTTTGLENLASRPPVEEAKLADWTGNWAPPPLEWDARPPFRDEKTLERIELWLKDACDGETIEHSTIAPSSGLAKTIAPKYWVPIVIEKPSPDNFLAALIASKEPKPAHEDDLVDVRPWWTTYDTAVGEDSVFLTDPQQPECKDDNPEETDRERIARLADWGSATHVENRKRFEKAQRDKRRRMQADQRRWN